MMSKISKTKDSVLNAFSLVFRHIKASLDFVLNNTIGLIFTRRYQRYNTRTKEGLWKKVKSVITFLVVMVMLYYFDAIFNALIKPIILFVLNIFAGDKKGYQEILSSYSKSFADGIRVTIKLSLFGTVIGFFIALIFSYLVTLKVEYTDSKLMVILKKMGSSLVKLYTTIIRGTPMMVQAMILYYGLKPFIGWSAMTAAMVTISINTGAYLTEILRGSINALDKGQNEGARSLGLTSWQTTKSVIYPQAVKNSMPAIGNEFVINIKDSAVLTVLPNITDLFKVADFAQGRFLEPVAPYIIAAFIYLFLTFTITRVLRVLEFKLDIPAVELPSSN